MQSISGNTYSIQTPTTNAYNILHISPVQKSFAFNVKTCQAAKIGLFAQYDDQTPYYEVNIGSWYNARTDIRKNPGGEVMNIVDSPNALDCNEHLYFW